MSKGDKMRGNREVKKPKKAKEKVVATAAFSEGKTAISLGQKKGDGAKKHRSLPKGQTH